MKYLQFYLILLLPIKIQPNYYYGDVSIETYLENVCHDRQSKLQIHIVHQYTFNNSLQIPQTDPDLKHLLSKLHQFLVEIKCSHQYLTHNTFVSLIYKYNFKRVYFRRETRLFIFDLTYLAIKSQQTFNQIINLISLFYVNCLSCLPIIAQFSLATEKLSLFAFTANVQLNSTFRSILISNSNSVLHLNPILDGCHSVATLFKPQNAQQFNQLKVPFERCNLNGSVFRVLVNQVLPFCDIRKDTFGRGHIRAEYSIEINLLRLLERKFNFKAAFIDGKGSTINLLTDRWIGIEDQLVKRKIDFALCDISYTWSRFKVADFTTVTYFNEITFISQTPPIHRHEFIFFAAFLATVFLSIGFLLVAFLAMGKFMAINCSYYDLLLSIWGIYLRQSITEVWQNKPLGIRILFSYLMFSTLILGTYYGSRFYSVLTLPHKNRPIDTVEDIREIAKTDSHYLLVRQNSALLRKFLRATPEDSLFNAIGQHFNRTQRQMLLYGHDEIYIVESSPRNVYFHERTHLMVNRYKRSRKMLHIGSEMIQRDLTGIMLPKRSPLRKPFNILIRQTHEAGLINFWLRQTLSRMTTVICQHHSGLERLYANPDAKHRRTSLSQEGVTQLTMTNMLAVYLLWILGLLFAGLVFVCELIALLCSLLQNK